MALTPSPIHILIPDTQVTPDTPTAHLSWVGEYIAEKYAGRPLKVVMIGDNWDMSSLSSYDRKGGTAMEGRRYEADIEAGNAGFALLSKPIELAYSRPSGRDWDLELHFAFGNHEHRASRAVQQDAVLEGAISLDHMDTRGWERHPFLEVFHLDGVAYSHYFVNGIGKPLSGMIETRIKAVGSSFTMGHQQGFKYGELEFPAAGVRRHGLIAGSCYLHNEDYRGPQGTLEWRGIVVCHGVRNGEYDIKRVSLDSLCRRYEGITLDEFMIRTGGKAA